MFSFFSGKIKSWESCSCKTFDKFHACDGDEDSRSGDDEGVKVLLTMKKIMSMLLQRLMMMIMQEKAMLMM